MTKLFNAPKLAEKIMIGNIFFFSGFFFAINSLE